MRTRCHYPIVVTLPDGRMAIVGGHNSAGNAGVGNVQYFDPITRTIASGAAVMPEVRGYHMIASLLDDGRILVGSGIPGGRVIGGSEQTTMRIYEPDYMYKSRPAVLATEPGAALGGTFLTLVTSTTPIAEGVLMALSSQTHSVDMNQRLVQLRLLPTVALNAPV